MRNRSFQSVFDFWDMHHGYSWLVLSSLKIQVLTYPEHKRMGSFMSALQMGKNFITGLRTAYLASTQDVI